LRGDKAKPSARFASLPAALLFDRSLPTADIMPKPSYLDAEGRMKRQTGTHVIQIKTVGELIDALKYVATHGDKLNGTWEVEWIADKVRLQMSYEMEAYEWSYT
jgi:hypothetical protein